RGRVAAERVDDVEALATGAVAERAGECRRDHLLGGTLRVVARLRPVDDATAGVLRCADRALTCVARALLLEGLAARTGDLTTTLGRVGALASRSALRDDDLVDQRDVRLDVEHRGGQLNGAGLLAVGATHVQSEKIGRAHV